MADCTKTVEFLLEWVRMCEAYEECEFCPLNDVTDSSLCDVENIPDEAIDVVQKWSDEHPVMTWEGKLRELLPNFTGMLHNYCPGLFFGNHAPSGCGDCNDIACVDCWNGEYKEPKT